MDQIDQMDQIDKPFDVTNVVRDDVSGLYIALCLVMFFIMCACSIILCVQWWDWYHERDNIYNTDNVDNEVYHEVPVVYQV